MLKNIVSHQENFTGGHPAQGLKQSSAFRTSSATPRGTEASPVSLTLWKDLPQIIQEKGSISS